MRRLLYLFLFLMISGNVFPQYQFSANFDNLVAGQRLACQDSLNWTTWTLDPCNVTEDPMVSNAQSSSNPNSVVIVQNNDVVRIHGDLATGKWYTGFQFFIPTAKAGYFNMLSSHNPPSGTGNYWAFECYFDVGGVGRLIAGAGTTNFSWQPNTWQWVELVIDLDLDQAKFYIGGSITGTLVLTWPWTDGSTTGVGPKIIDATDLFGATANDQMYVDNFFIGPVTQVPVELTSFGANVNDAGQVVLNWATSTETNNEMFIIERAAKTGEFVQVGQVKGHGTTTEAQSYSFIDEYLAPGAYLYRLKQVDFNGTFEYSNVVEVEVTAPMEYALGQNYPNPFNPSTQIDFSIAEPTMVKLAVYNLMGQEVQVIKNEFMQAGLHQVQFDASSLPSGMYIYKLETANFVQARKLMLMK